MALLTRSQVQAKQRADIRNRVIIAAGELNRDLGQKEIARIADDLAECAMMLREIGE